MGTTVKKDQTATGVASSEKHSQPTQIEKAARPNSTLRVRDIAIAVGFGVVGWALCGAVVGIGTHVVSMNTTLIIHAAAVPVIFGSLSLLLFKKLGATNPLQTAIVFLGVVITLDFFIVSLLIEGNFEMFRSFIGTWLPFALIFVTTYLCGAFVVAGRATGESGMIDAFAPTDRIRHPVLMEQPVKDAGFVDVRREFVPHVIPSEVVVARKPVPHQGDVSGPQVP